MCDMKIRPLGHRDKPSKVLLVLHPSINKFTCVGITGIGLSPEISHPNIYVQTNGFIL